MAKNLWEKGKEGVVHPTRTFKNMLCWLVCIAVTVVLIAGSIISPQISIAQGDVASEDIFYEGAVMTYTSDIRTSAARTEAAAQVAQVFRIDNEVLTTAVDELNSIFAFVNSVKNKTDSTEEEAISSIRSRVPGGYNDSVVTYLLSLSDEDVNMLRDELALIITQNMQNGVTSDELSNTLFTISQEIEALNRSDSLTVFLQAVVDSLDLQANKEYDAVATAEEVDRVMEEIEPVQVTVQPGEKLVSKGAYVTAEQIEALSALGMLSQSSQILPYLGLIVFVCLLYFLMIWYIRVYKPLQNRRPTDILLIGVIMILTLVLCKVVSLIRISDQVEVVTQIGFLMPVSAASMLLCVLLGKGISIFATMLLSIFASMMMSGQMIFGMVAIVGGMVGIFRSSTLNQRSQFMSASLYIAAANMVAIVAWGLINGQSYKVIGVGVLLGILNGVFASVLSIGLLPFIESGFRITTMMRLMELSNTNNPLLKRLMMEAPGTYHHSVLVGNLAEAAATEIGADPLIVRVASYYHDVGKLKRPFFFIENQMNEENVHDKLQPNLSTLIITSHVKDGVEMLREQKFPEEIIRIAEQHHGNSVLSFFYRKAQEQAENPETVRREDFCYPGPRPSTKESALVMLADSVQAAVQSMNNPSKGQVEQKIREIIKAKVDDGQLEECPLTFGDLDIIAKSFTSVLVGMHHHRIVYPDEVAKQMKGGNNPNDHKVDASETEPAGELAAPAAPTAAESGAEDA